MCQFGRLPLFPLSFSLLFLLALFWLLPLILALPSAPSSAAAQQWHANGQNVGQQRNIQTNAIGKLRVSVRDKSGKNEEEEQRKKQQQIEEEEEEKHYLTLMIKGNATATNDEEEEQQTVETEGILDHLDYLIRGGIEKPQQPDPEQPREGGGTHGNEVK